MNERAGQRPNPDALLEASRREEQGGLKVFLGAAPGVGKTYQMLQAAHELKRQGVDVVVGIVETHGREETEALCDGLEVIPLHALEYRGRTFHEFDLDAVLNRKPAVVLVDELAHRNIPGARHARRYQDIEELLDNGIDVWTAVNIQHLDSLTDVVARITGVRMRETVPDKLLERARDVVLVDLTPSELIDRLQRGKVYVPEQARAALDGYFSPSNLAALRELAVQTIAERIDQDVRERMQVQGVEGPWPVRSRILVAVDARGQGEALVRAARRIAERRRAPWTVVTVDTGKLDEAARERLDRLFELADRLGAELKTLRGYDVADELLAFAREQNATTLVLGRSSRRGWLAFRSTSRRLMREGDAFEITFVPVPAKWRRERLRRRWPRTPARHYIWALASVAVATVLALFAQHMLPLGNLSLIFLTAVLVVAARTGIRPALVAAGVSFLTYNFFFTEPRLTFHISRSDELSTVVFFLLMALIGGQLAGRLRQQIQMLRATNDQTDAILQFTKRLAAAPDLASVYAEAVDSLADRLRTSVVILERQAESGALAPSATGGAAAELNQAALSAAQWAFDNDRPSGFRTDTLGSVPWRFQGLGESGQPNAVLGVLLDSSVTERVPETTLDAYIHQISLAILRTQLAASLSASKVAEETERLRSALLSSISHDLRTPLSSMIGSASSLRSLADKLSEEDRNSLLDAILNEGQRLDRYIRNLLDMTKLGHGTLKIERDWIALTDILASALRRTRTLLDHVHVERRIADDLPLLFVHPALIEQAVVNVLENAARFAPAGSRIVIEALTVDNELHLSITDQGPGIPESQRERVFDMFFTGGDGDRGPHGSGLGLAICSGMIGAHGGHIEAQPGFDGVGTRILITLPLRDVPEDIQEMA